MSESAAWEMIGSSTSPQKSWTSFYTRVKETKEARDAEVRPEDVEDVDVDGSELWGPRKLKME